MSDQNLEPLAELARSLGHAGLPETVEALAVAVERGHHIALAAAEGSGVELLYALAATLRCDPESDEVQALILAATPESALRCAGAVAAVAGRTGVQVSCWPPEPSWGGAADERPVAHVVAGSPDPILADVRSGGVGLSELRLLVVDRVDAMERLGSWPACAALLDTAGSETQKILCSASPDRVFLEHVESKLPRARRWPPEIFPGPGGEEEQGRRESATAAPLWIGAGAGEMTRLRALADGLRRLIAEADPETAVVWCDGGPTALRVRSALAALGFQMAEGPDDPGVRVVWEEAAEGAPGAAAFYGLPSGLPALLQRLRPAAGRLAVVPTRHRSQMELLARRAGWPVRDLPTRIPAFAADEIAAFRDRVRDRAETAGTAAELLLLEPLMEEIGGPRVAAALAGLLREEARPDETAGPAPLASWTRIYVNVGRQDGAGPADLLGAITGESSAVGGQVGKIEIRTRYSLIEIDSLMANEVIQGLTGTKIKGRMVTARVDRAP